MQLTAAVQAQIVRAQVVAMGGSGSDGANTVRRLSACPCRAGMREPKSFAALLRNGAIAPELAYVTASFAALAPFARVADLLSELLPIGGAANPGTVRNRTLHVGETVAQLTPASGEMLDPDAVTPAVIAGLDGGYVCNRHRRPGRNFEIVAGKVTGADGTPHRFAFARNGGSAERFAPALVRSGVRGRTRATVLSDGDAGLRNLQRWVLPPATVVLDWFYIAMRFEHALQAAIGLDKGTIDDWVGKLTHRDIERAKWRRWHGRWEGGLMKLAGVCRWTEAKRIRGTEGVRALRHHLHYLIAYLEEDRAALVNYGARRRRGEPIATAFVESAINEIVARRMIKKQPIRWNRWTVQLFLDVRVAVLDDTLENSFCKLYSNFQQPNDPASIAAAA